MQEDAVFATWWFLFVLGLFLFCFFCCCFFTIELNNFIVCNKAADLALKKMYNNQDTLVFLVTDLMYSSHSGVWTEAIILQACLIVWGTLAGCITVGLLYQNDMFKVHFYFQDFLLPWHCTSPAVFLSFGSRAGLLEITNWHWKLHNGSSVFWYKS